ncbi:hypothetical protein DFH08DRAFT_209604 [Mycena albidolilacea]|uniref:Uncharacterized protein n=1 Tax=Mycena albidolilacea TaxID=1033008 RepID=A0AAD7EQM8_9AGAR|nr:hypothetical protein DFH08DRAFT_209604 [Mycena albidolilacea]
MAFETQAPHSFNRPSWVLRDRSSHRRYNSEPFNALLGPRYALSLFAGHGEILLRPLSQLDPNAPPLAAPAPVSLRRTKLQYSIRRPRPNTECFGVSESHSPEIVLGEPKEHIGHPKTRIRQPVLKLAAIKERLEHLEATNDRLQQRIESYKTDAEMLSSSVTYFSSEYYAGLLTIRDLRTRSQQDAEIMSKQEHQLCQLKKFIGLMVEIGLHEPVLERAHQSVIVGEDIEPVLVEAIRNAASRRGSAWSGILSAVDLNTLSTICPPSVTPDVVFTTDAPDVFEEHRQSTVDNLLKDLEDGNIPVGRHRSASHRLASPACKQSVRVKSPNALLSPGSPARRVLGKLDVNRSPPRQTRQRSDDSKKTVPRTHSSAAGLGVATTAVPRTQSSAAGLGSPLRKGRRSEKAPAAGGDASFSNERAIASLQRLLDNFSSGSFGSLGSTTDGTQSGDCDSSAEMIRACHPLPSAAPLAIVIARSPVRPCVRSPTVMKRPIGPAATPTRNARRSTAIPLSGKKPLESTSVAPNSHGTPSRLCCRTTEERKPRLTLTAGVGKSVKAGWR